MFQVTDKFTHILQLQQSEYSEFSVCGTSTLNSNVKKGTNVQIFDSICVYISFKILFDFLVCVEMNSMSALHPLGSHNFSVSSSRCCRCKGWKENKKKKIEDLPMNLLCKRHEHHMCACAWRNNKELRNESSWKTWQ